MGLPRQKKLGNHSFVSRFPFYYGWVILVVGSLGVLASIPGQTMGVSVFTDYFINDLAISRVGISSAYMVGTLISASIIPFAGIYYDKRGARFTSSISTIFLALFLLILGYSKFLSTAISSTFNLPLPVGVFIIMTFGFFGIRFFGQGVLTIVARGMVAKWFSSRRGLVVGLMGLVTSFGFSYAPRPLQALISHNTYQSALAMIAFTLILFFLPIFVIFSRSDPASCNIEMERGLKVTEKSKKAASQDAKIEKSVKEARREPLYWIILISMGYWGMFSTAFTFHVISIFNEKGMDATNAVKIFFPISIITVIARFGGSYLSDKIKIKWIFIVYMVALVTSSVSLMFISTPFGYVSVILTLGVGGGLFGMLNIITWPKLYGKKNIGAISGFAMSIIVAGSAIGPWIFSMIFKYFQTYSVAGLLGFFLSSLLLIAMLVIKFPQPESVKTL
jgi:cyanate permease